MAWRHMMFAVDSSLTATPLVLNKIVHLAKAFDAEVELFHCVFDRQTVQAGRMGTVRGDQEIRAIVAERQEQLGVIAERLTRAGVRTRSSVRWDYPSYEGIIRQVLRHKPDLLIAQSSRHARLARMVLTHTDYKLIEACPCPLLLMKSDRPYTETSVVAAVDPMHAHSKPAALDRAIVENARTMSSGLGASLHLYHACAPWPEILEPGELRRLPKSVYEDARAAYEHQAAMRVKALAHKGFPKNHIHLGWGEPTDQLPAFASSVSAGVVVMGAVSRSRIRRAFIGHTAERVLDALDCDVMIVKQPDFRSPVSLRSVHRLPKGNAPRARYVW